MSRLMISFVAIFLFSIVLTGNLFGDNRCNIFLKCDPASFRAAERNASWTVAEAGKPRLRIVYQEDASKNELITNTVDWINDYVRHATGKSLEAGDTVNHDAMPTLHIGFGESARKRFEQLSSDFKRKVDPGQQGFVLTQVGVGDQKDMVCWSPTSLGCRYGLIEFLRSLKTENGNIISDVARVVDAPDFPVRIYYVNFAEHLQNAYNPNMLFESEVNRWTKRDWERFIDMLSAYRFNVFEFWLAPTLMGTSDAMRNGPIAREFAATINHVIAYGKRRGVSVHPIVTVNTLGPEWNCNCPNDPKEKKEILDAWDYWTKTMKGNDSWGIFPGDPGGCRRNGCTKETYVDLSLELSEIIRKNNPGARVEVGTWGEPFSAWGIPLWTADPELARKSMEYFLQKLPEFPEGTFTSINTGFSPDSDPTQIGGDGRPFAKRASRLVPVLTWNYSATDGEATVYPHCRVRRMIEQRKIERDLGCYSGGITYTVTPQLQYAQAFCAGETWWNVERTPEEILSDFGRLTFGEGNEEIGWLIEEFEVVPDWGYYAPFPYTPQRLAEKMSRLDLLLERVDTKIPSRLPLATSQEKYTETLVFFAGLFRDLAEVSMTADQMNVDYRRIQPDGAPEGIPVSLSAAERLLAEKRDFDGRDTLESSVKKLRELDVPHLKDLYWKRAYGIYDHIVAPVDSRTDVAMNNLFNFFKASSAYTRDLSALEEPLRKTQKPFLVLPFSGDPIPGWTMKGWDAHGDMNGESWLACMSEGILSTTTFKNEGYKWLVLRVADGPSDEKKIIWINGQKVAQFQRSGSRAPEAKEWEHKSGFITKSYPIPEGLLETNTIEIKFTEPGIAIAGIALSVEPIGEDP